MNNLSMSIDYDESLKRKAEVGSTTSVKRQNTVNSFCFNFPYLRAQFSIFQDLSPFEIIIQAKAFNILFPVQDEQIIKSKVFFVKVFNDSAEEHTDYVYQVKWNTSETNTKIDELVFVSPENLNLVRDEKITIFPFETKQITETVEKLSLEIKIDSVTKFIQKVKPFPVNINQIKILCRQVLQDTFFNLKQKFNVIYKDKYPINVKIKNISDQKSLSSIHKIGAHTQLEIIVLKDKKEIEGESENIKKEKIDLKGALYIYPANDNLFTFSIVKVKSALGLIEDQETVIVKEWIEEALKKFLLNVDLMVGNQIKIQVNPPQGFIYTTLEVTLSLDRVSSLKETIKNENAADLYEFDEKADYKIDFLRSDNLAINLLEKMTPISSELTIKILEVIDVKNLADNRLHFFSVSKEQLIKEIKSKIKFFTLGRQVVKTSIGNLTIQCLIKESFNQNALYELKEGCSILIKQLTNNLVLLDSEMSPLEEDKIWDIYMIEQFKNNKITLPIESADFIKNFIKLAKNSLYDKDHSKPFLPLTLCITGSTEADRKFIENFISTQITPIHTQFNLSNPPAPTPTQPNQIQNKSPVLQMVAQVRNEIPKRIIKIIEIQKYLKVLEDRSGKEAAEATINKINIFNNQSIVTITVDEYDNIPKQIWPNCQFLKIHLPSATEIESILKLLTEEEGILSCLQVNLQSISELCFKKQFSRIDVGDLFKKVQNNAKLNQKLEITDLMIKEEIKNYKSHSHSTTASPSAMYL